MVGGALFTAFLAEVSTKLDLIARATEDKVAQRRREGWVSKGEPVRVSEGVERSQKERLEEVHCRFLVVVFFVVWRAC
jgi:hypothetical protein